MIVGGEPGHITTKHEIRVVGIGGAGCNAIYYLCQAANEKKMLAEVDYLVANLDPQSLDSSLVPNQVVMGNHGAGANPQIGRQAAEKHIDQFRQFIQGAKLLFIAAGMGGGTGTGGAPIIARIAKELQIPAIAVVSLPFRAEGQERLMRAAEGMVELFGYANSVLIIDNERLRQKYGETPISKGFKLTDSLLAQAVESIVYVIRSNGTVNVDINDIRTILVQRKGPIAMGQVKVHQLANLQEVIKKALESPFLLEDEVEKASYYMVYVTYGSESNEPSLNTLQIDAVGEVIWGYGYDPSLGNQIRVTVLATGFPYNQEIYLDPEKLVQYLQQQGSQIGNATDGAGTSDPNFAHAVDWNQYASPTYLRKGIVLDFVSTSEDVSEEEVVV